MRGIRLRSALKIYKHRISAIVLSIFSILFSGMANALVIDFETDATGPQGQQFVNADNFIFAYDFIPPPGSVLGLTVAQSFGTPVSGGDGNELIWTAGEFTGGVVAGVIILPLNNEPFDLNSLDIGIADLFGADPGAGPFTVRITGTTTPVSAPNIETVSLDLDAFLANPVGTVTFSSAWDSIYRFEVELFGYQGVIGLDNINLTPVPLPAPALLFLSALLTGFYAKRRKAKTA